MRFKMVAIAAVAALSFGLIAGAPAQAATPKAGAACAKAGITQVVKAGTKTTKFTCVKSGKKTVWNKGVVTIAKPAPKPTPTAEPTVPAEPLTLDNLDPNWVRKVAYAEFVREFQAAFDYSAPFTNITGPKVSAAAIEAERPGLERAQKFWGDIFQPKKIFLTYVVAEDADWIDAALCAQANNCPATDPRVHSWGGSMKRSPANCTGGQATATNDGVPLLVQCIGPGNENIQNKQTGPHEYTHLVQQAYTGPFPDSPRWFLEGSAVYFGGALGLYSGVAIPKDLNYVLRYDAKSWRDQKLCDVSSLTVDAVVGCFKFSYLRGPSVAPELVGQISGTSYYPGSLVTEAMVAVYGVPKIKAFMKEAGSSTFDAAFSKTFGITVDSFYPKVAKYVLAMYEKGL